MSFIFPSIFISSSVTISTGEKEEGYAEGHLRYLHVSFVTVHMQHICVFAGGLFDIENILLFNQAETIKCFLKGIDSLTCNPSGTCVFMSVCVCIVHIV